jgi:hypothetical protein
MELLNDPRLQLTPREILALKLMDKDEAIRLLENMIAIGSYGVDPDHGPEPAMTHYCEIYYGLPDETKAMKAIYN